MDPVGVVLVVHNRLDLTRACLESLRATTTPFELCVVDNASTDGTGEFLRSGALPWRVVYEGCPENIGLIRAMNVGWRRVRSAWVCFLHNDTELREPQWLERLAAPFAADSRVGLAGLYGARRVRRDGRYAGRTIVHCLGERGRLGAPWVEVAAVDGVCLFLSRAQLESLGGFDEGYGFFHGYDRDLSFAVRETGRRCVVVDAPFVHHGGGTRTSPDAPVGRPDDLAQRRAALTRFATKWQHRLPSDVRTLRERLADRLWARR